MCHLSSKPTFIDEKSEDVRDKLPLFTLKLIKLLSNAVQTNNP